MIILDQPPNIFLPQRPAIIRPVTDIAGYFPVDFDRATRRAITSNLAIRGLVECRSGAASNIEQAAIPFGMFAARPISSIIAPLNITFDGSDGWVGYNLRQRISSSIISGLGGTRTRVLFRGNKGAFVVGSAYIGRAAASGNAWNFASAPTALLVGGSSSFTIPNGAAAYATDWCNFTVEVGANLILSVYCNSATGDDLYGQNIAGYSAYYRNSNIAGDIAPSQFTTAFYSAYSHLGVIQVY